MLSGGYALHVAGGRTALATALKITREDATVYGFTSHDITDTVDGVEYDASPGLIVSDIVIAANAAVGNLELTTLHDGTIFDMTDVFNGKWRNAAFVVFRYRHEEAVKTIDEYLLAGTVGEIGVRDNVVVAELRDLRQYLQQPVGSNSSKTCRYRLGSTSRANGGLCMKDLTAFTYTGTITHVTSNEVFRDSARGEAVNWFDEGEIRFDSGPNAGVWKKIKAHAADGTFTLALPYYGAVAIGHAYTVVKGCRKRREDCVELDNILNFGGEPDRKGLNDLMVRAEA